MTERIPEQKDTISQIREKMLAIYRRASDVGAVMNAVADYAKVMRQKYPDTIKKTATYHALIGSTVEPADVPIDDFKGEDSVLEFVKKLEKRFLSDTV